VPPWLSESIIVVTGAIFPQDLAIFIHRIYTLILFFDVLLHFKYLKLFILLNVFVLYFAWYFGSYFGLNDLI